MVTMTYTIQKYSQEQAKKLGVTIKPSKNKNKKIDVFKNKTKVASIGDIRYKDYATYLATSTKDVANKRRQLYKARHNKTRHSKGSNSFYADRILW